MITRRIVKKEKLSVKERFKRIGALLNPAPLVGGLEISDSIIRFVQVRGEKLKTTSLKLPPGIIIEGRISDKKLFIQALRDLYNQAESDRRPSHVVVTLPSGAVYAQVFSIPAVQKQKIREAARLNLQMISPIDFKEAYYDYELLSESPTADGQFELLGAFVRSIVVDDYMNALEDTSFVPVAIEFPALSLARLIESENLLESQASYLLANLTNDGVEIIVLRNRKVYSHHFTYWKTIEQEGGFDEFIVKEVKRIISFYVNRYQYTIDSFVLVSEAMDKKIGETLTRAFPKLNVRSLSLGEFPNVSPTWFVALGAALRGLTPRFRDRSLTLTPVGAEEGYFRSLTLNFIHMWRNILFGTLAVLVVALFIGDVFLARFSVSLSREIALSIKPVSTAEADLLLAQAEEFNSLLNLAGIADEQSPAWSTVFEKILLIAQQNKTSLNRTSLSPDLTMLIVGQSESEKTVLDFKNAIDSEPGFENVALPLTEIEVRPDGTFLFTMTFKVMVDTSSF